MEAIRDSQIDLVRRQFGVTRLPLWAHIAVYGAFATTCGVLALTTVVPQSSCAGLAPGLALFDHVSALVFGLLAAALVACGLDASAARRQSRRPSPLTLLTAGLVALISFPAVIDPTGPGAGPVELLLLVPGIVVAIVEAVGLTAIVVAIGASVGLGLSLIARRTSWVSVAPWTLLLAVLPVVMAAVYMRAGGPLLCGD